MSVEPCEFVPNFAAQTAVALESEPKHMRWRRRSE